MRSRKTPDRAFYSKAAGYLPVIRRRMGTTGRREGITGERIVAAEAVMARVLVVGVMILLAAMVDASRLEDSTMEDRLVEYGEYPEIYAECLADLHRVGNDVHIVVARWRRLDGIYQRCVVGEIIRPLDALRAEFPLWQKALGMWVEKESCAVLQ